MATGSIGRPRTTGHVAVATVNVVAGTVNVVAGTVADSTGTVADGTGQPCSSYHRTRPRHI